MKAPSASTAAPSASTPALPASRIASTATPSLAPGGALKKVCMRPVLKKQCPICQLSMNIGNVKKHIERRHTKKKMDITATYHLRTTTKLIMEEIQYSRSCSMETRCGHVCKCTCLGKQYHNYF